MKTKAPQKCGHAFCLTCRGEFRPLRPWQVYCSDKCRFTHRAARQLAEAFRAGRADGLREIIRELAAPAEALRSAGENGPMNRSGEAEISSPERS